MEGTGESAWLRGQALGWLLGMPRSNWGAIRCGICTRADGKGRDGEEAPQEWPWDLRITSFSLQCKQLQETAARSPQTDCHSV